MRGKKRAGGKGLQTWNRRGANKHVSSVKVTNSNVSGVELLELFREGYVANAWFQSKDNLDVTIGVLTTGPRLQNACNDTFLQPNYYTYSNSDLEVNDFDLTRPTGEDVTILSQSNRHITLNLTPQESREP
jgi:hypothetical protein